MLYFSYILFLVLYLFSNVPWLLLLSPYTTPHINISVALATPLGFDKANEAFLVDLQQMYHFYGASPLVEALDTWL